MVPAVPLSPGSTRPALGPELPAELGPVLRHLEATYPEEGCGVLLRRGAAWRVRPLENAYARHHAVDPARFPRSARTAFLFEPREWLGVCLEAEASGEDVACVFHSHPDGAAHLSAEDRAWAAPEGEPLLPGTSYLVVSVLGGRARAAKLFWWEAGAWAERGVRVGP